MLEPTLAVAGSWVLLGLLLAGLGYGVRLALGTVARLGRPAAGLGPHDVWAGLAALLAWLVAWSLFRRIDAYAGVPPAALGAAGAALGLARTRHRPALGRRLAAVVGAGSLLVLWLANLALGEPTEYDSGLYHFQAIGYAERFGTLHGLGNISDRLGAADAHLLYTALLERTPWHAAGFHLANGFLVAALAVDALARLAAPGPQGALPAFTRVMAPLGASAVLLTALANPGSRLSSPNLDLATCVLVVAGSLYLVQAVESEFEPAAALASTAAFTAAALTRGLALPALVVAVAVGATGIARTLPGRRVAAGPLVFLAALPAAGLAAWAARQAVLTAYPLYPAKLFGLSADWRMPGAAVDAFGDTVRAWARTPHADPSDVLGSWGWLSGWLGRMLRTFDVVGPLTLAGLTVLFAAAIRPVGSPRDRRLLLAAVGPSALTLVVWFVTAPDPRFVWGFFWLVPIGCLTSVARRRPPSRDRRVRPGTVVAIACGYMIVIGAAAGDATTLVRPHGAGPLHVLLPPTPRLADYATASGLRLSHPIGDDRCWRVLFCTPSIVRSVHRRGSTASGGFAPDRR